MNEKQKSQNEPNQQITIIQISAIIQRTTPIII